MFSAKKQLENYQLFFQRSLESQLQFDLSSLYLIFEGVIFKTLKSYYRKTEDHMVKFIMCSIQMNVGVNADQILIASDTRFKIWHIWSKKMVQDSRLREILENHLESSNHSFISFLAPNIEYFMLTFHNIIHFQSMNEPDVINLVKPLSNSEREKVLRVQKTHYHEFSTNYQKLEWINGFANKGEIFVQGRKFNIVLRHVVKSKIKKKLGKYSRQA